MIFLFEVAMKSYYVSKNKVYSVNGDFKYKEQIEEILENFDFKKVKKVMKTMGFEYKDKITKENLKKNARMCLETAVKNDYCSCGRFEAFNIGGLLSLRFYIDMWDIDADYLEDYLDGEYKTKLVKND